ncbi:MAG TPA: hypothetical protein VJA20_03130 [Candidatus Nanoarchaeia archaeon]|nr:hypothetical protein [Candidatus Nanoarchaeia archaeon]
MRYRATFGVDYGVYYKSGGKYPDYLEIKKSLIAKDDFKALLISAGQMLILSRDYPINPKTNFTKVTLIELYNEYGNLINPKETLKIQGYNRIPRFKWEKKNKLFTKCSKLEHLIILELRKKISKYSFSMS